MKQFPPRIDIEKIDVCLCGNDHERHEYRWRELLTLWSDDPTGQCKICQCPKYKKEKTMLKKDYDEIQNLRGDKQ